MYVISKYFIPIIDEFTLALYRDDKILSIQLNDHKPCMYVLIDKALRNRLRKINEPFGRTFKVYETGEEIEEKEMYRYGYQKQEYIGSYSMGEMSFHVFEEIEGGCL
jgi:hypothetical protein